MITVEATETFSYKDYDKVEILVKQAGKPNEFKAGDRFKCDEEIARYLGGENPIKRAVVKVIEVEPKKTITEEKPATPKKKKITKK